MSYLERKSQSHDKKRAVLTSRIRAPNTRHHHLPPVPPIQLPPIKGTRDARDTTWVGLARVFASPAPPCCRSSDQDGQVLGHDARHLV